MEVMFPAPNVEMATATMAAFEVQMVSADIESERPLLDIESDCICVSSRHVTHPRERRLLQALFEWGEVSRHELDGLIGAENSPDVIFRMRRGGWELPCKRRPMLDRDGKKCQPGFYRLSNRDRQAAAAILGFAGSA